MDGLTRTVPGSHRRTEGGDIGAASRGQLFELRRAPDLFAPALGTGRASPAGGRSPRSREHQRHPA